MGIKKTYVVPSTRLRCRSGLVQSCYERTLRLTIHLLGVSSDEFGAYDGVIFSPKSVTPRLVTTEIRFFALKSKKEKVVLDRGQNGF